MKRILISSAIIATMLFCATSQATELYDGVQKYKASRLGEFLSRMDGSAAKFVKYNDLSFGISFSNYHLGMVDDHLNQLISNHNREMPFTSVTYYVSDPDVVDSLDSAIKLKRMSVNVDAVKGASPCIENDISDCSVYLIQFYTTEKVL